MKLAWIKCLDQYGSQEFYPVGIRHVIFFIPATEDKRIELGVNWTAYDVRGMIHYVHPDHDKVVKEILG